MAQTKVMNKAEYQMYLNSPRWQALRKRLYRSYEYKCAMCGSPKNLQVHHITYENLGAEKDEDLTVLCQKCHSQVHDRNYTFFDDLCQAWSRLYEKFDNETDETQKGIIKIQMDIVDRAMDLVACADQIYEKRKSQGVK